MDVELKMIVYEISGTLFAFEPKRAESNCE